MIKPSSDDLPNGTETNGADASAMLESLPSPRTKRWVCRRKAAVVTAVEGGVISKDAAKKIYGLSEDEFLAWCRAYRAKGIKGLRATHPCRKDRSLHE